MNVIRTPDARFEQLPDFDFDPNYVEIDGLRVHYLDEGSRDSNEIILCLHGEPTWSYLYRKMVRPLSQSYRFIALDFPGFGRSDKYTDQEQYSFQLHFDTLKEFIEVLDLSQLTLVMQDWGGLIGLPVATSIPERVARLVIMNTGMPTGDSPMPEAFLRWRRFVERLSTKLPVGRVIRGGLARPEAISKGVISAYEAPFPDERYKAGAVAWPLLVPIRPEDPGAAQLQQARNELRNWHKPTLVMFSDSDPITEGIDEFFRRLIPAASEQPNIIIEDAGHYLQEEAGEEIAQHILDFVKRTRA
jgi:haloalkane dehalogenase